MFRSILIFLLLKSTLHFDLCKQIKWCRTTILCALVSIPADFQSLGNGKTCGKTKAIGFLEHFTSTQILATLNFTLF